ncbi:MULTISPECIES: hypothetical protein [unclassified Mesorhizobium]|uniref:hypothetical protein n=1 Tax=unclassified Mesorhizobium TaxID=325217 RepID=UPI00333C1C5D
MQNFALRIAALGFVGVSELSLVACSSKQFAEVPKSTPVVPLSGVINTLKCGISNALASDTQGRSGLLESVAVVGLNVNIVEGTTLSGHVSAGIPISVGSVSPSLTASREATLTNNSTIDFGIILSGYNELACQTVGGEYQDAGFSLWLGQVVREVNVAVAGAPYAFIQKYTYDSNFVVKKSAKAGVDFEIVPVKLGGSIDSSRSDVQHINITIQAVSFDGKKKNPRGKIFDVPPARPVHTKIKGLDAGS